MTNTKNTRRALLASVLSIALCLTMLVGSTFAWFTDSASASVNTIQAGTLDISLEMATAWDENGNPTKWEKAEGKTLQFKKAAGAPATEEVLWEPGCTYQLPELRVINNGNLHLKYMLSINGIDGDAKLNKAIEWSYGAYSMGTEYVALAPKATSEILTIKGHMKEEAGNEYKGLSIDGISITVFATQLNKEYDSIGPDYDKDAPTLVMIGDTRYDSLNAATKAAQNGDTIEFSGVFTLPTDDSLANKTLTFKPIKDGISVIDMKNVHTGQSAMGADLTFEGIDVVFDNGANYKGIAHADRVAYKDCTITGKQFMYATTVEFTECELINYTDYCVWTYGTNATFTKCTFTTGGKAIYVYNEGTTDDTVTVTNCTFNTNGQLATDKAAVETGSNTADSKHTLIITNSTANGFAANNSTSPLWGNKHNMDGDHLKVTVDGVATTIVASQSALDSATGAVYLLDGEYNISNSSATEIIGNGNTVLSNTYTVGNKTVKNCVVTYAPTSAASGSRLSGNVAYENCTFVGGEGKASFWADSVAKNTKATFTNCTFESMVKCGGGDGVSYTFTDCDFYGPYSWKYMVAYADVTLDSCNFAEGLVVRGDGKPTLTLKNTSVNYENFASVVTE